MNDCDFTTVVRSVNENPCWPLEVCTFVICIKTNKKVNYYLRCYGKMIPWTQPKWSIPNTRHHSDAERNYWCAIIYHKYIFKHLFSF